VSPKVFHVWDLPTVSPLQRLVAQVHSDFGSRCIQNGRLIFLFIVTKLWYSSREGGELRLTEMVCGVRDLV
jgi:hypothetical protein